MNNKVIIQDEISGIKTPILETNWNSSLVNLISKRNQTNNDNSEKLFNTIYSQKEYQGKILPKTVPELLSTDT
jgi:hypothetical protein